ncbi:MAG TPA: NADH-quinone oxidoreductase subunit NuoK [Phycisphaerae bacterium]|nr:NADH-quinone oxidoreductase subunit NuoK [Phycisphaerae bacterium]HRY67435.1 NADH-quinone oxidoreductase subunit NuoK [Phycisphaerae bacterium]HSA28974.1 NADH-quinone oxidoreductase subunit NuoK [Phycisphaerae bacterium]
MGQPLYDRLEIYLVAAAFLLAMGIFGLVWRRTLIGMLISGELLFAAASLNLMAFNRFTVRDQAVGQVFVLFIMGLAAAEVAIALSITIAVYRNYRSVKTEELSELNG